MTNEIYTKDKMQQLPVYPTKQTPSYADWNLFEMGKALEDKVDAGISELPTPTTEDAGMVLKVNESGEYALAEDDVGTRLMAGTGVEIVSDTINNTAPVPIYTTSDDGKILGVTVDSSGETPVASVEWTTLPTIPSGDDLVPAFTTLDEGKVLEVVVDSSGDTPVASAEWTTLPTQVQADWNESDSADPSYIKNKPTIPSGTHVIKITSYTSGSSNPQDYATIDGVTYQTSTEFMTALRSILNNSHILMIGVDNNIYVVVSIRDGNSVEIIGNSYNSFNQNNLTYNYVLSCRFGFSTFIELYYPKNSVPIVGSPYNNRFLAINNNADGTVWVKPSSAYKTLTVISNLNSDAIFTGKVNDGVNDIYLINAKINSKSGSDITVTGIAVVNNVYSYYESQTITVSTINGQQIM